MDGSAERKLCDSNSKEKAIDGQKMKSNSTEKKSYSGSNDVKNPSPPPELLEAGSAIAGDAIGDTVFSERWVLQALMKLTELVAEKNKEKLPADEDDNDENIQELDKDIETQLCQLWDMAATKDVVHFLLGLPTLDLIADAMTHTKIPRLTEIAVGIIGNMACEEDALGKLTEHAKVKSTALQLLDTSDPPTLTEVFRLLLTCIQSKNHSSSWLKSFHDDEHFLPHLTFIMASSTNVHLLATAADFVDYVLDISDDLCSSWATSEFVDSLLEAVRQVGVKNLKAVETFLHVLQLLSTSNEGKVALTLHAEVVVKVVSSYLNYACTADSCNTISTTKRTRRNSRSVEYVSGHEAGLASALLLVHILLLSSPEHVIERLNSEKTLVHVLKLTQLLGTEQEMRDNKTTDLSDEDSESEPRMLREILEGAVITLIEELLDNKKGGNVLLNTMEVCNENQCRDVLTWMRLFPGGHRSYRQLQDAVTSQGSSWNRLAEILQKAESVASADGGSRAGHSSNENG